MIFTMTKRDISIAFEELVYDELPADERALADMAMEATERSYAPYSRFRVGAAIALDNGVLVPGSNQENVAYPSGTCAERSACFYAHARYPEAKFVKIAVAARGTDGEFTTEPTAPCGACRQALLEYEVLAGHDVPLLLVGRDTIYRLPSVRSTLPFAFSEF